MDCITICGKHMLARNHKGGFLNMIKYIKNLLGSDYRKLYTPIFLLIIDAIGVIGTITVLRFMLIDLLSDTLNSTKLIIYSFTCLICIIYRVILFPKAYTMCFMRGADLGHKVRINLAEHIRNLKLGYFNQNSEGYLLNTMTTDIMNFESTLTHVLPFIIKYITMGILIVIGSFFIEYRLAIAEVILIAFAIPVLNLSDKVIHKYENIKRNIQDKAISIMMEYMEGITTFKSYNMTGDKFDRLYSSFNDLKKSSIQAETKLAPSNLLFSIIVDFLTPLIILLGSYMLIGGNLNAESLVSFLVITLVFSNMLKGFCHYYNMMKKLKTAVKNLNVAMSTEPLPFKYSDISIDDYSVDFNNVSFSYEQGKEVLHQLSFSAPMGSTTALIGSSGSGKSTIASLIARFWDIDSGKISVGGVNIKDIDPNTLLAHIGIVFQDVYLMNDTLLNNIRIGNPSATYDEVINASKSANCHDFILNLPNGYDTVVSEGGSSLSGGERQRISIARAFLKNAPILLLDESTSALDSDNEQIINQSLDSLMQGKTTFVIAHRLNTIINSDQILVLDDGKVEESGNHESLLEHKGHYFRMIQEQERAKKWAV